MMVAMEQKIEQAWQTLRDQATLSVEQLDQLKRYLALLTAWNENMNLTAITEPLQMIAYHLHDALKLGDVIDMAALNAIADVGTGGGIPGIPLKIRYPHLAVYLLEVNHKKIRFLNMVIKELGLTNIQVIAMDWRTFLRKTSYPIDLFCSRASLDPDELIRMFKPSCPYNGALLIYWASVSWQASKFSVPYVKKELSYDVGNKRRKFIFLSSSSITDHTNNQ